MIFPYEIRKATIAEDRLKPFVEGMILVVPRNFCLPKKYIDEAKNYLGFEIRPDDVWILGHLESGTLMAQSLARLLCNEINGQKTEIGVKESDEALLEASLLTGNGTNPHYASLSEYRGRRFIRTHLPISLLPHDLLDVGCKVIYLARNPKDVAASMYTSNELPYNYSDMPFGNFLNLFTRGLCCFGSHLQHVKEAWQVRNRENFLFMLYEDMVKDSKTAIRQFADFLNVELVDKEVKGIAEYMTIDGLRSKKHRSNGLILNSSNSSGMLRFMDKVRKNGGFDNVNEDTVKKFDKWVADSLRNTELCFPQ